MQTHELVEPFDVDDASLDGLTPQVCFSLGVEWQMFRARLADGETFTTIVLASNAERLTKMAERHRRYVEHRPANDGWAEITVGDYRR